MKKVMFVEQTDIGAERKREIIEEEEEIEEETSTEQVADDQKLEMLQYLEDNYLRQDLIPDIIDISNFKFYSQFKGMALLGAMTRFERSLRRKEGIVCGSPGRTLYVDIGSQYGGVCMQFCGL